MRSEAKKKCMLTHSLTHGENWMEQTERKKERKKAHGATNSAHIYQIINGYIAHSAALLIINEFGVRGFLFVLSHATQIRTVDSICIVSLFFSHDDDSLTQSLVLNGNFFFLSNRLDQKRHGKTRYI